MRSIKDYKEAMDNIRISEDFYERSKALLNSLPESLPAGLPTGLTEDMPESLPNGLPTGLPDTAAAETRIYEKKPVFTGKKITAVLMAAAACMMFVFGVRLALENGRQDISAPMTVTETVVSDRDAIDVEHDPAVLIDDIDENGIDDIPVDITPEEAEEKDGESGVTSVTTKKNEIETKTTEKTASTEKPPAVTAVTTAESAPSPKNEPTDKDTGNAPAGGASAEAVPTEDVPENNNDGGAETPAYDDGEAEEDIMDDLDYDDDEVEDATVNGGDIEDDFEPDDAAAAAPQEPLFSPPDPESVSVTVTSGSQSAAVKSSADRKTVIDLIAKLSDSPETRAGSFTPLFTVKITDKNGRTVYTVYLTDKDSLVIESGTSRAAVALSVENCETMKQTLQALLDNP